MNILTISGRTFKDPEVQGISTDLSIVKFTIVNNDNRQKNKETGKYESVGCFVDCQYWTKNPGLWLRKISNGTFLSVSGKLKQETWGEGDNKRSKKILDIPSMNFPEIMVNPFDDSKASTSNPPISSKPPIKPAGTISKPPIEDIPF